MNEQLQAEMVKLRLDELLRRRQLARTDLLYLCNKVLGYKDVSRSVHGEILDYLQHFEGGTEVVDNSGRVKYTPAKKIWELVGPRNNLLIYPRGHLKTTVATIAFAIQWILNYPDVRIALSMAVGDQTKKVMTELKGHFQFNPVFRWMFPDFCPVAKRAADWGSMDEFRIQNSRRKEPTLCLLTVGKVIAGSHYDVILNSDLVDEVNVKTPGGIAEVIQHVGAMEFLTERYSIAEGQEGTRFGWQYIEGTIYDFGDLHVKVAGGANSLADLRVAKGTKQVNGWNCLVRSAKQPRGMAEDGKSTIWPERFPYEELSRIEALPQVSPQQFSCQMLANPIPPEGGLCDAKDIVFLPRHVLSDLQPRLRLHCTIDLHGLEPAKNDNDYTVITLGGFDHDGRLYIVDIRRGRFTPDMVIWHIFDLHSRYQRILDFKIEKDAHARVLLPFLQREASKRQRFPTMVPIKRDTHVSKQQRIRGLQPWFKAGIVRFADDLSCKTDLILEIMQFPSQSSGVHDDILDTLADMMQNQEGGVTVDVMADPPDWTHEQFGRGFSGDKFIGFEDGTGREIWNSGIYGPDPNKGKRSPTGIM